MSISFVYSTCRENPYLEWFVETLYTQYIKNKINIQLVIVDYYLQFDNDRKIYISNIINNKFEFVHISPMPCMFQGLDKITKNNYFSASLPRNTGICHCKYDYICFIDDLCALGNNSLDSNRFCK